MLLVIIASLGRKFPPDRSPAVGRTLVDYLHERNTRHMASGKEGWVPPGGGDTVIELDPPQLVQLPDGQVQIRFESFMVPEGAEVIVPTFTLSRFDLNRFADSLKAVAAQTPTSTARN